MYVCLSPKADFGSRKLGKRKDERERSRAVRFGALGLEILGQRKRTDCFSSLPFHGMDFATIKSFGTWLLVGSTTFQPGL